MNHGFVKTAAVTPKIQVANTEYNAGDFVYLILDSLDMVHGSAVFRISI